MSFYASFPPGFSQPPPAKNASGNEEAEPRENLELDNKTYKKRKPGRRAKGNNDKEKVDIKIIHSNVDGYTSKKESINEIVEKEKPDIMTLNDTNLKGKLKVKIPNYFSYNKTRDKNKGGVSTVVANHLKHSTMKVTEGKEDDEYIVTRFENTVPALNIINIYGTQESRTNDGEIERSWLRLMKDVSEIEDRNEALLIIGDMNRKVGNDEYGVKGNKDKISYGGQLIRNMIKERQYVLINNLDLAVGGPWTWVDRQDSNRKSCLDLGIMSVSLLPFLTKVEIDVEKKITPRRVLKRKNNIINIFTDHFSLKVEFSGIPKNKETKKPEPVWNLGKPTGWKVYEDETNKVAEQIKNIVEDGNLDIDTVMRKIEVIDTKIKFMSFGKTKPSVKKHFNVQNCGKACEISPCDKCKPQKQKDIETHARQTHKIESAIEKIKESKQGRVGNVFMMKKDIAGPKKAPQEAAAIKDPKTGELLVNKEDIKKATLEYCVNNLKNNVPASDVKETVYKRKREQTELMNDKNGETFDVTYEDFEEVLAKFTMKSTKTYDFLLNAGLNYRKAIFTFCKRVIDEEDIPECFHLTTLVMIWKRKGAMDVLKNNRFLHMKNVLARTVDALVVKEMKSPLISRLSIYQVGGLPGHSIAEHLLTIKTVMARMEDIGEGVLFLVMDIISFFDKEDIYDCLETMKHLGINKKAIRMWYLLNRNTKIRVKTAFGMSEEADVGDCLGQGTGGAGLVSAANLDLGLQNEFKHTSDVMYYGNVRIQPLSYQDDVGSLCSSVKIVRKQAQKMTKMLKHKILNAHPDKSGFLALGSPTYISMINEEIKQDPIYLNSFVLKLKTEEKYLGQILKSSLSTSALATAQDRAGKIKGATLEIKQIIEDYQMQAIGGLAAAWDLWERALIPSLFAGASRKLLSIVTQSRSFTGRQF